MLAAAAAAGCGGPGHYDVGRERFAMNVNLTFGQPAAVQRVAFAQLRALGVEVGRADTFWSGIEPAPGRYDWRTTDERVRTLARAGIRWLPIVDYSAPWAVVAGRGDKGAPDAVAYAAFAAALARRYGPHGSFWHQEPRVPALPVHAYEIWNEPDLDTFWRPRPDPAAYAALYAAARAAIRRVDRRALVVTGGLFPAGATDFLGAMLRARPSIRGGIDAIGYHAYGSDARAAIGQLDSFLHALPRLGLAHTPIWLTEFGWPLFGNGALAESTRAAYVRDLLAASRQVDHCIAVWAPFTWMDARALAGDDNRVFTLRGPGGTLPSASVYGDFIDSFDAGTSRAAARCG